MNIESLSYDKIEVMKLAFVTPTLGRRIVELRGLLDSISKEIGPEDECIIVAQENLRVVQDLVDEFSAQGMKVRCIHSPRGISIGKNCGVKAVNSSNPLLVFPNDSNWFSPGVIDYLHKLPESFQAGAMTLVDKNGPRFALPVEGTQLDKWNVWKVLEATLLMRKMPYEDALGFDEGMGTGCSTPWQAGEGTDLLLRSCVGAQFEFHWLPNYVTLRGLPETVSLTSHDRKNKLRAYGRGLGRVLSKHHYPVLWRISFVFAGLLAGVRSKSYSALDGVWAFIGRAEGVLGKTINAPDLTAVKK